MFHDINLLSCRGNVSRTVAVVCAGLFALSGQVALAQSFDWDKIGEAFEVRSFKSTASANKAQIILGKASRSNNEKAFDDWYRQYLFPAMANQALLADMHDNRSSLAKDLERCADPQTHEYLLNLAFEEAKNLATGNYHPAVRFNAFLIIGNLNQVERRQRERLPPIRFAEAFNFLMSELQKPDQRDVLRLAALLGIERHLRLASQRPQEEPIKDAEMSEVATLLKTLADQKTPPEGRAEETHQWLRRRAISSLAAIGKVGDGQSIFNTFMNIVGDGEEPLSLRCVAARAIGQLDYTDVEGIDPIATAHALGALAADACRQEDSWIKEKQKELDELEGRGGLYGTAGLMGGSSAAMMGGMMGNMMGGMSSGGMSPMGGGPPGAAGGMPGMMGGTYGSGQYGSQGYGMYQSEEALNLLENARRRLKLPIHCVKLGISGEGKKSYGASSDTELLDSIGRLANPTQALELEKIEEALDALIKDTDYVDKGLEAMMTRVRTGIRDLEELLPTSAATEDAEGDGSDAAPDGDLPDAPAPAAPPPEKAPPAEKE